MKTPDYSKYIKISIDLVKKSKWLLIFGALVGSGGGMSFNSGSNIFKTLTPNQPSSPNPIQSIPGKTANVLGTFTSSLQDWFYQIPLTKWLLFILLLIILAVIGIITVLIVQNWARGALIAGIKNYHEGNNLSSLSPPGFKYLKELIFLSLLIFAVVFGLTVILPLVWIIIFLIIKSVLVLSIIWIILGVLAIASIILTVFLLITMINAFAQRLIVLKDYRVTEALKKAVIISRRTLLASTLTGVINFAFKTIVGILSAIILAIIIGLPSYLVFLSFKSNPVLSVTLGIFTTIAFIIFIVISSIISASLNVFSYSNWNQLFEDYLKSEGGTSYEK